MFCHEEVHIAKKDYLKNLVFVLLTINWFQPLMWLAYYLLVKDVEVTCDEMVLRARPVEFRKQYAKALLELSTREARVGIVTIGYGSVALKERIEKISRNKRVYPIQRIYVTSPCVVVILLGIPAYWYIRKLFGYVRNSMVSTNEVWEVRTGIYP